MQWDDLRVFLATSRHPQLERVAATLGLDPTTVSRRLKRLESDLGITLFERTRRGHILTSQGEAFLERAEGMEALSFDLIEFSRVTGPHISGKVRLGVTEGLGTSVLAPALADFAAQYPQIDVELIALSGFVSVSKRQADMSILLSRPETGRLKVRKLIDYDLGLYASPSYLAKHQEIKSVEDLAQHRLIGYVDDLIYSPHLKYLDQVLSGSTPRLSSPSIMAQYAMATSGAGVAILPRFMTHEHSGLRHLLKDSVCLKRSFWLVIHEDVHHLSRIRAMADFLSELVNKERDRFAEN